MIKTMNNEKRQSLILRKKILQIPHSTENNGHVFLSHVNFQFFWFTLFAKSKFMLEKLGIL